jgi:hypothetical protein
VFCSRWLRLWIIPGIALISTVSAEGAVEGSPRFEFHDGDRIVLLGSTFIERLQSFGLPFQLPPCQFLSGFQEVSDLVAYGSPQKKCHMLIST